MKGKDLVKYIKEHKLEEAELDIGASDPLQFVVTIPGDNVSEERELVYDFSRDFVYENYISFTEISYDEAKKLRNLDINEFHCGAEEELVCTKEKAIENLKLFREQWDKELNKNKETNNDRC